ncbi:hypothetical protein COU19_02020 [Candidatus Kaiserbacteria bacterium CG10_big_fil_rev_8_21_14_0_10_56_12]|uniref:DNA polymerase III subunit delta n=1 Tax=Candidatus Kaiserbacteria bacterium CG10_big_fil_rev_8_21_14_0_10_56_12 TaxID=1974611 RepID=A0A2H0U9S1_9BACT|nr:MAG: hypothetical protein COU19_02020 [Candidatus Kaiserbacteria bacterium CG10_big_fil_rev_8_21_14_0_10_56_12]
MQHHAFVIEAEADKGIEFALGWVERELGLEQKANPDVVVLRHGLFSVEDARQVSEIAIQAPLRGTKRAIIIAAARAYREAQNALLKIFEEPVPGTHLFLILPTLGGLLPTLRSRVVVLRQGAGAARAVSEDARVFLAAAREKRTAMIKRLSTGRDEDERRTNRDRALAIVNGVEATAYEALHAGNRAPEIVSLLRDTTELRTFLHDRSAPVRMILEHLSLVIPRDLSR